MELVGDMEAGSGALFPPPALPPMSYNATPPAPPPWLTCTNQALVVCPRYTWFEGYCCDSLAMCDTYCGWDGYSPERDFYWWAAWMLLMVGICLLLPSGTAAYKYRQVQPRSTTARSSHAQREAAAAALDMNTVVQGVPAEPSVARAAPQAEPVGGWEKV